MLGESQEHRRVALGDLAGQAFCRRTQRFGGSEVRFGAGERRHRALRAALEPSGERFGRSRATSDGGCPPRTVLRATRLTGRTMREVKQVRVTSRKDEFGQNADHSWVKFFRPGAIGLAHGQLTPAGLRLLLSLTGSLVHGNEVPGYSNRAAAADLGLAESTTSEALGTLIEGNLVRRTRLHGLVLLQVNPSIAWVGDGNSRARERQNWDVPFV